MKLSKKAKGNTATPKATPKTTPKSQNKKKAMMNTPEKIEVDQDQIVIGAGGDELKDEKVNQWFK